MVTNTIRQGQTMKYTIYTDGSYNAANSTYGGAYYIIELDIKGAFSQTKEKYVGSRNIAGECGAIMLAVWNMLKDGQLTRGDTLNVYYDYSGLSKWYHHEWKANSDIAKDYVSFMDKLKDEHGVVLAFHKVKAHSGDLYNDIVDELAKQAVGIEV